ncbi:branched-chain-amino-acid aminotransferase-like protein 1 [Dorcoceras hygrometricum]|uniref:Branched-chain-amino-acid aminotransferase-like protein 1 n=1 Tax=Dorcoceras hygrometricum TaxID=472368 RepID=A0A2Z7ALK3_9LAMI|nr:branched-chain-amino-acid aminotransferase-like protein 1 [Dorcoceras hygrometricum]
MVVGPRLAVSLNQFLQALSVIPRGSWGDVARRSYHDPMGKSGIVIPEPQCRRRLAPPPPPRVVGIRSGQFGEENPSVQISSRLLVQGDEGVSYPVVDRIGDIYRNLPRRADVIVTTVGARHKCQQGYHVYSAGRGVDPAGGAPRGG